MAQVSDLQSRDNIEIMSRSAQILNFIYACFTFIVHNLGPVASKEAIKIRMDVCDSCTLKDPEGKRLFRKDEKSTLFCGRPLLEKKIRDPRLEGCGCFLEMKWKKAWTSCPNKLWE